MSGSKQWACDGPVSQPEPPAEDRPAIVMFGGFAFSSGGITHDINAVDIEQTFTPTFAPGE
jgi:hypothetical protein